MKRASTPNAQLPTPKAPDPTAWELGVGLLGIGSSFRARVLAAVRRIPRGRVATYGDVASWAGRPRAWRAVGNVMRGCDDPSIPCHRVVAAAGALGGYGGNLQLKRERLRAEGVDVGHARIRRFPEFRWAPRTGSAR